MRAVDYIPAIVAFVALIVGIVGRSKWDEKKRGLQRLTPTGRITLGIGIAALIASAFLTWRGHVAADLKAQQQAQLRSIAHAELRLAVKQITGPFFILFGDDTEASQLLLVPDHIEDTDRLAAVMQIDVRSKDTSLSGSSYPVPWSEVLNGNADRGVLRIDRTLQIYAAYLEPDVIATLSELRYCEFLVLRLQGLDEYVTDNSGLNFLPFPFTRPTGMIENMDFGYGQFWSLVRKLDGLLLKEPDRLTRRL